MRRILLALLIPSLVLGAPLSAHEMPTNTLSYSSKLGNLTVESIQGGAIFNGFQVAAGRMFDEGDGPQVWEVAVGYADSIATGYVTFDAASGTILETSGMDAVFAALSLFREKNAALLAEFARLGPVHKQHEYVDWGRCTTCSAAIAFAIAAMALACVPIPVNPVCAAAVSAYFLALSQCFGACRAVPHEHPGGGDDNPCP
jgi:hypothetical protein